MWRIFWELSASPGEISPHVGHAQGLLLRLTQAIGSLPLEERGALQHDRGIEVRTGRRIPPIAAGSGTPADDDDGDALVEGPHGYTRGGPGPATHPRVDPAGIRFRQASRAAKGHASGVPASPVSVPAATRPVPVMRAGAELQAGKE